MCYCFGIFVSSSCALLSLKVVETHGVSGFGRSLHRIKSPQLTRRCIQLPKSSRAHGEQQYGQDHFQCSSFCQSLLLWTRGLPCKRPPKIAVVYHEDYSLPDWDKNHRFVMSKFDGIMNLILQDEVLKSSFRVASPPAPASPELLQLVHCPVYIKSFMDGSLDAAAIRKIGLPWSPGIVRRTCLEVLLKSCLILTTL